jgi:hypothetical protein
MKLIKKVGIKSVYGTRYMVGLFECPKCLGHVERIMFQGKKRKRCNCYKQRGLKNECNTRLYSAWTQMKSRCYDPNHKLFRNYALRGIIVCIEWRDDYLAFKKWAFENGYRMGLVIHRINNDGNYEPNNCCFLTQHDHGKTHNGRSENALRDKKGRYSTEQSVAI